MVVPCLRPDSPRDDDMGLTEESALILRAIGKAKERGFDWTKIPPEDRGDWARRVLEWEADAQSRAERQDEGDMGW